MQRDRQYLGFLPAIALALYLLAHIVRAAAGWEDAPRPEEICTEDMACWDCDLMGNRVCGVER